MIKKIVLSAYIKVYDENQLKFIKIKKEECGSDLVKSGILCFAANNILAENFGS